MPDERRKGDERPTKHDRKIPLNLTPTHNQPFRWLPRHGEPSCIGEWFTQQAIRQIARAPVYTFIVAVLTLLAVLFLDLPLQP